MTQEVIRYCTEHLIKTGQVKFPNFRKKPKGRSLNPSPSVRLYADIFQSQKKDKQTSYRIFKVLLLSV